ncbi:hypothetical protein BDZ91DRAFT_735064 [Kalaharituber pfeilii]|nr:hypothetical protein BDZ91DRAFT_735064 [Kalaharituber pfeilii]
MTCQSTSSSRVVPSRFILLLLVIALFFSYPTESTRISKNMVNASTRGKSNSRGSAIENSAHTPGKEAATNRALGIQPLTPRMPGCGWGRFKCGEFNCCDLGEKCMSTGECCDGTLCASKCCDVGFKCLSGECCPYNKTCGPRCCAQGEVCQNSGQGKCCPLARSCGAVCCPDGEVCQTNEATGIRGCCASNQLCGMACCGRVGEGLVLEKFCLDPLKGLCCDYDQFVCGGKCCPKGMLCSAGACSQPTKTPQQCNIEQPWDGSVCKTTAECPQIPGRSEPVCHLGCCSSLKIPTVM